MASVDDFTLEQLAFICSGLSPLTHVKDLMVSNRGQLKLGSGGLVEHWVTGCHKGFSFGKEVHL